MKKTIAAIMLVVMVIAGCGQVTHAKNTGYTGMWSAKCIDGSVDTYIVKRGKVQTGLFKYNGNYYYGFKTDSVWHPKGTILKDGYKVIKGKWYYFGRDGKMATKSTRSLTLRKNRSVKYVYATGKTMRGQRINTKTGWYQMMNEKGKWVNYKRIDLYAWTERQN